MNSNSFRMGVGTLALALVCGATAQSLSGVEAKKLDGGLQVRIQGNDLGQPKTSWSKSKRMFFLTFDGKLASRPKTLEVGSNGVQAVSYEWLSKKTSKVRVALSVVPGTKPEVVKTDGSWAVNFNVAAPVAKVPAKSGFPTSVPPIEPAYKASDLQANASPNFSSAVQVDLEFVNTDIVQILKALALQSNVNIVTSPEVSGKITVTLNGVSVKDALDIVTALGGVRYAKVGGTYVVTSSSRFSDTVGQILGKTDVSGATRVVPLRSSQGVQIKASVLKMVNPSTLSGRYDLILPSDNLEVTNSVMPGGGDKSKPGTEGSSVDTKSDSSKVKAPDDYIVIIGTSSRLDEVEATIRAIDNQLCQALGVKTTATTAKLQKSYHVRNSNAVVLLNSLKVATTTTLSTQKNDQGTNEQRTLTDNSEAQSVQIGSVQLFASTSNPVIALSGRAAEVENLVEILEMLDTPKDVAPAFLETVDLMFIKPHVAAVELMANFSGLKASILPAPVDPLRGIEYTHTAFYNPEEAKKNSGQGGGSGGSGGGSGSGSGGSGSGSGGSGSGSGSGSGGSSSGTSASSGKATQWEAESITWRTPMKVLLRGTREQIDQAKQYLALVDIAPKQVAVEVRVMELSRDDALKIGLDWSLLTGGTLTNLRVNQGIGTSSSVGGVGSSLGFKGGGTASITGTLDAIANKNNLLARPNILLSDGVLSNIFVGDTVRYVKAIQPSQNGTTIETGEINVGVDFSLAAKIGAGGNITLDFHPVLSILQGFTDVPGGGQLPQTSVRSATSQVQINSGETIAIGGLIQDQDRKSYGGIPILKDLPIIGQLFGRTNNSKVRSEIVFFVTVKEVTAADRQSPANPRQATKDNNEWPGNGNGKKG